MQKSNVPIEQGSLSIEHVMPQTKGEGWLEVNNVSFEELEHLTLGALRKAVVDGDVAMGTVMAGQIALDIRADRPEPRHPRAPSPCDLLSVAVRTDGQQQQILHMGRTSFQIAG